MTVTVQIILFLELDPDVIQDTGLTGFICNLELTIIKRLGYRKLIFNPVINKRDCLTL